MLHDDEVTYSIVAGVRDGVPRGVRESYRLLSGVLASAYQALGVDAALTSRSRGVNGAACYLHSTAADLSLGAAKLSGSAQVWDRDSCLQHGSFVISRDVVREARVFRLTAAESQALGRSTATIEQVTGRRPEDEEIHNAVCRALESHLNVETAAGGLTAAERASADETVREYRVDA